MTYRKEKMCDCKILHFMPLVGDSNHLSYKSSILNQQEKTFTYLGRKLNQTNWEFDFHTTYYINKRRARLCWLIRQTKCHIIHKGSRDSLYAIRTTISVYIRVLWLTKSHRNYFLALSYPLSLLYLSLHSLFLSNLNVSFWFLVLMEFAYWKCVNGIAQQVWKLSFANP